MPDQPQQSSGFGGTLKSKWGPLPVWGWLAVITAAAVGYYLWSRRQGAQQQQPTVGQPGVVVINQDDTDAGTTPPKPPEKKPGDQDTTRQITVGKDETLGQLAKQRHWSQATLKEVEQANVTAGQGAWTPGTKLTKGQTVIRPIEG